MFILAQLSDLHALLCVCELFVITNQMFLIPRVLLDVLVVFNAVERHLAEAVIICNVSPTASQHAALQVMLG